MTVVWDPPVEPNGKIVGYVVIYYEEDNQEIIFNVPEQRYKIENLKPFRIYRISVACKSSGGIGPNSGAIKNQTQPGGESLISSFALFRALSRKELGSATIKFLYIITIRSKLKRFSRSTRKIYTPALCATINLICRVIMCYSS